MRFLTLGLIMVSASTATAQQACFTPLQPDAGYLIDSGYEAQDIRDAYRGYFSEVEDYLNCLNRSSARIRQEATTAAQDYGHVLDQYPAQLGQGGEPPPAPRVEMSETGTLFLDYKAEWLQ
jgi:hypothetical protein